MDWILNFWHSIDWVIAAQLLVAAGTIGLALVTLLAISQTRKWNKRNMHMRLQPFLKLDLISFERWPETTLKDTEDPHTKRIAHTGRIRYHFKVNLKNVGFGPALNIKLMGIGDCSEGKFVFLPTTLPNPGQFDFAKFWLSIEQGATENGIYLTTICEKEVSHRSVCFQIHFQDVFNRFFLATYKCLNPSPEPFRDLIAKFICINEVKGSFELESVIPNSAIQPEPWKSSSDLPGKVMSESKTN